MREIRAILLATFACLIDMPNVMHASTRVCSQEVKRKKCFSCFKFDSRWKSSVCACVCNRKVFWCCSMAINFYRGWFVSPRNRLEWIPDSPAEASNDRDLGGTDTVPKLSSFQTSWSREKEKDLPRFSQFQRVFLQVFFFFFFFL